MKKLLNVNGILDETYDLYKKYLGSFIGYTALMHLTSIAIAYNFIIIFSVIAGVLNVLSITDSYNFTFSGLNLITILIISVIASAIFKMNASGPINGFYADKRGEKVTFGNMFRFSFKNIWYTLTSSIAYYSIVFGVLIIGGLLYYLIYTNLLYTSNLVIQIIIGIVIGLILLAFYIWFCIKSLFYLQVAICERKHFFSAIVGSFNLTKGNYKRIIWISFSILLSYLIIYISSVGMVAAVSNILSIYLTKPGMAFGIIMLKLLLILIQLAGSVAIMPILHIAVPVAYANERNRLYGDDLHRDVNVLLEKQKEELK